MDNEPYSPSDRLDAWRERIYETGHWQVSHEPDPSFVVVPPRPAVTS